MLIDSNSQRIANNIIIQVAHSRGLQPLEVLSRCNQRHIVSARADVAHQLRMREWSLTRIALALGYKDHTTVINLLRKRRPTQIPETFEMDWGG